LSDFKFILVGDVRGVKVKTVNLKTFLVLVFGTGILFLNFDIFAGETEIDIAALLKEMVNCRGELLIENRQVMFNPLIEFNLSPEKKCKTEKMKVVNDEKMPLYGQQATAKSSNSLLICDKNDLLFAWEYPDTGWYATARIPFKMTHSDSWINYVGASKDGNLIWIEEDSTDGLWGTFLIKNRQEIIPIPYKTREDVVDWALNLDLGWLAVTNEPSYTDRSGAAPEKWQIEEQKHQKMKSTFKLGLIDIVNNTCSILAVQKAESFEPSWDGNSLTFTLEGKETVISENDLTGILKRSQGKDCDPFLDHQRLKPKPGR